MERFEAVAQDGEGDQNVSLANSWGFHQPRVTVHNDGTVRVLYFKTNTNTALGGPLQWKLMKRASAGGWSQEATGYSYDDIYLFRDPSTDLAHVLAWPSAGVPAVVSGPSFTTSSVVPGTWPRIVAPRSRNYGGAGIGADGTFCLKASRELQTLPETSQSYTDYICGKHNSTTGSWSWGSQVSHYIGARHAYDYIYPGASGVAGTFLATSEANPYKNAVNMSQSTDDYIFNGVRFYSTNTTNDASWFKNETADPLPVPTVAQGTRPPAERQNDGFLDSKQRVFSTYYSEDPLGVVARGMYLAVQDTSGRTLFKGKLNTPSYGYVRVFEDAKQRLWVLWTSARPGLTSVWLYRLNESGTTSSPAFQVASTYTVFDSMFAPYEIMGNVFIAAPRAGSAITNSVDGMLLACDGIYQTGVSSPTCFPSGSGKQRVFSFHLRLPD